MALQTIPIEGLTQRGMMKDFPDVSLPLNGFTDLLNVRLHDNAIRKLPGEKRLGLTSGSDIIYVAYWPNSNLQPNDGYYVYVAFNSETDNDDVYIRKVSDTTSGELLFSTPTGGTWNHTLFGGGFTFIINNGITTPRYINTKDGDTETPTDSNTLPGFDEGYFTLERVVDESFDSNTQPREFNLGQAVDFSTSEIVAYILDNNGNIKTNQTITSNGSVTPFTTTTDSATNTTQIEIAATALVSTDQVIIEIKSLGTVRLTCKILKTFGDSLIAGDLTERDTGSLEVVRRLTGAVRISDIAAPGGVPTNWNPFATGVSTADEFILSSTGIVQDIVELQGRAIIYTNHSIHSLTPTGSTSVPFSLDVVTEAYGAHSPNSVVEIDGTHMVVGSNDIYNFSGHPGNIQSMAHGSVRYYLYNTLSNQYAENLRVIRHNRFNEVWICYPDTDSTAGELNQCLIYNYREGHWTRRKISDFKGATVGLAQINGEIDANQLHLIFCGDSDIFSVDSFEYADKEGAPYKSHFQKLRLEMQPIYFTETIHEFGMWGQSDDTDSVKLYIDLGVTDGPGTPVSLDKPYDYETNTDYKADVRITGRVLSFQVGDYQEAGDAEQTKEWHVSGIQLSVGTKGRR